MYPRVLGLDTLWNFRADVTWSWNRTKETTTVSHFGYACCGTSLDSSWNWDGVVSRSHHYFLYDTSPHLGLSSGFHHMVWGHYNGPAVGPIIRNEYPRNVLEVHDDGTWYWETHCCASPSRM